MKEYRFLAKIRFFNNYYNIYVDSHNKYFYLKINKDNSLAYLTLEELINITLNFRSIPNVMNIEKTNKKLKLVPKVIIRGVATVLTPLIILTAVSVGQSQKRLDDFNSNFNYEEELEQDNELSYATETEIEEKKLDIDTYLKSDNPKFTFVYDMDYLDRILDYDVVTKSEIFQVISKNTNISERFKELLCGFVDSLYNKYPNIDLRVFYENLKTLKIVECDKKDLVNVSLSMDSYGCYIRDKNIIYVLKGNEYKEKTWAYQVIYHELCHCLRVAYWDLPNEKRRVLPEGPNFNNVITSEALNSLFSVSLFNYEETNIAYQLQSNYLQVIIDCMDNYNLGDYVQHSLSYFAKKMDEFNGDENYATIILDLIQLQYDDFHSKNISVDQEQFYPIYDYILSMYYKKYVTPDNTYNEIKNITTQLLNKITFDVPEDYKIDVDFFYDYMNNYCREHGIVKMVR